MKDKSLIIEIIIFLVLIGIMIGGYFLLFNTEKEEAFLKLEKITLKDEKKVTINKKELTLKLDNGLLINGNKVKEEINTIYSTGEYLIITYQGQEKDKYLFINEEGKEIEVIRENISEDAEFTNLRLDTNKLVADTNNEKVEITYKEGKITIKK